MKVIVSISGDNIESRFDPRFGRAAAFCLFDSASSESSIHDNPGLDATGGAGIVAAQFVAELGAQAVVSGAFGPNAFDTLEAAGVAMYAGPTDRAITAREVIDMLEAAALAPVTAASAEGHHGGSRRGQS